MQVCGADGRSFGACQCGADAGAPVDVPAADGGVACGPVIADPDPDFTSCATPSGSPRPYWQCTSATICPRERFHNSVNQPGFRVTYLKITQPAVSNQKMGDLVTGANPCPHRSLGAAPSVHLSPKFVTAYSLAFSTSWRRVQHFDPWIQTSSVYQTYTIPASNVVRTVDAAPNRAFATQAFASQIIYNVY